MPHGLAADDGQDIQFAAIYADYGLQFIKFLALCKDCSRIYGLLTSRLLCVFINELKLLCSLHDDSILLHVNCSDVLLSR